MGGGGISEVEWESFYAKRSEDGYQVFIFGLSGAAGRCWQPKERGEGGGCPRSSREPPVPIEKRSTYRGQF